MPVHGRMSSIRMQLRYYRLQLPVASTAKYEALTELVLSVAFFDEADEEPGGGRTLGDFVSSCCSRLRKLGIHYPEGLRQLVLRTGSLEELELNFVCDMQTLDVTAPSLRVLKLSFFRIMWPESRRHGWRRLKRIGYSMSNLIYII
ncbi:hypothetical protein PR202_ga26557 [Eleusine coracana subsp. coracana]|uniref:Uncharacterized protein n=1 Tax=Eleusine coracana subsp. coracana TaxID=191504 RepID=A0AAV5DED4_ELECO|nr:hypothetical protein PR202_ga26557 [Eleusine coracana subsp. coracana]